MENDLKFRTELSDWKKFVKTNFFTEWKTNVCFE